ncbi:MAG: hypothetical protein ACSLFR_01455 [Solirubrobacteraceae bacterium]
MATKLRETVHDFEARFAAEAEADRQRRDALRQQAIQRSQRRRMERTHAKGTVRFTLLVLMLIATAVLVTVAMFQALLLVMG